MTPRTRLPRAAIASVREARSATQDAAGAIRRIWRKETRDPDGDYAHALDALARATRLLDEATYQAKGGDGLAEGRNRPPQVGDTVWFFDQPQGGPLPVVYAATVTAVDRPGDADSPVELMIAAPPAPTFRFSVPRGRAPGCWDWPRES